MYRKGYTTQENDLKMWTYALFLFALCGGSLVSSETSCEGGVQRACSAFLKSNPTFPKTDEDVQELCPKILTQVDCVQNYIEKCDDDSDDGVTSLPKIKAYFIEVCNEDSNLRADLVKELPCIKELKEVHNDNCIDNAREVMLNYLEENDPDYEDSPSALKYYCFYLTARLSCIAGDVDDTCGDKARDLVLDAHLRMGYLDSGCDKEDMDEVLQLVALLEIEQEHKERIGSILRTHKGSDDLISTYILR